MIHRLPRWLGVTVCVFATVAAHAEVRVGYDDALLQAKSRAPGVAVIRATEQVAEADSRVGGLYPNPTVSGGTSTESARLTLAASVPLAILGQRSAALAAGRAEYAVAQLDGRISLVDLRAAAAHAFVGLWLAEHTALAREDGAKVSRRVEASVKTRVEVGTAPELEGLRAHAERLRADLDARSAGAAVDAASAGLVVWIGAGFDEPLRALGDPNVPDRVPALPELERRIAQTPSVQRAFAELRASEARASSERAQNRPLMTLDFGADLYDPTLPGVTNYHAQLGLELPLFNQRGPLIEREQRKATVARSQARAEQARSNAELIMAYRTFRALTEQVTTLREQIVPTAQNAAQATEDSYALGRAPLVAVLDAERARIDAELSLVESEAARANVWIDVERTIGVQ